MPQYLNVAITLFGKLFVLNLSLGMSPTMIIQTKKKVAHYIMFPKHNLIKGVFLNVYLPSENI